MAIDDDYNLAANRPPDIATSGVVAIFFHLLKASLGSGILFIPHSFQIAGWVSAIVCSLIIGTLVIHTAVVTVQCSQELCKRARVPSLDFAGTCEMSFKLGPKPLQNLGKTFATFTNIIVCTSQFKTAVVYTLYIATAFMQVIEHNLHLDMHVRFYIMLFLPFFLLLSLIPNFAWLAPFSIIGSIFLFSGLIGTTFYLLADFPSPSRMQKFTSFDQIPLYCTFFLFAMHLMTVLLPLENTMKKPEKMPCIIVCAMTVNIMTNLTFGFLGYNKYIELCDTVIKNLPMDQALAQMIKVVIALSVLFTYGLMYMVPVKILWPMIASKVGDKFAYEAIFRMFGVFLTTSLAAAVPHMLPLLGLLTALTVTTIILFIPILIELATKWDYSSKAFRVLLLTKNFVIGVLWFLLVLFGVTGNLHEIIVDMKGLKPPEDPKCIS
ncbi:hypothetical protein QAD02_012327 [Eretmocerus hayati]|uniref:Uncharacterized protein n=1 Tax=Eretmocerus hayati TaxID=131215 RepID=A0ACC2NZ45_9HYME|nr:hypothetical protein QAD02_012327 [Eretmocerus hayati]